ncbi:MAG: alpha/beta fold hydrolase [Rhodospirillales bacterium]|nr:alpha/beta fold hydrolase [Rhodospirillales bacterium]
MKLGALLLASIAGLLLFQSQSVRASGLAEEVFIKNDDANLVLAGTLTKPDREGPFAAVLLVTGSGPQDRDETIFGHKPFKVIAEFLSDRGYLVLRYDDRGVGQSTGEHRGTTVDFATDARAGVDFLLGRPDVDRDRVGILGHSEGATIGAIVAARQNDLAFLVMLAGSALPGDQVLRQQIGAQLALMGKDAAHIERNDGYLDRVIALATADPFDQTALTDAVEDIRAREGESQRWAEAQTAFFSSGWVRHVLTFDPGPTLSQLRLPVLALFGETDRQVLAEPNGAAARAALRANPLARVEVVSRANHLFQTSETGDPREYATISETISPVVLELIAGWLSETVR